MPWKTVSKGKGNFSNRNKEKTLTNPNSFILYYNNGYKNVSKPVQFTKGKNYNMYIVVHQKR